MSVKRSGQLSFGDIFQPQVKGRTARLDRIGELVDWSGFEPFLNGLREAGPGRPGYKPGLMFRMLLLQSMYGLSDPELEEALADRLSFRRFCGLALTDDIPDHSTICRFRQRLTEAGLLDQLFSELDRQLEAAGVMLKQGTMLDATLIESQASRLRSRGVDPVDTEAGVTRRQGKKGLTFGYKGHIGADRGSGLIRSVITTSANVNDTVPADLLIRGDEREVLGDAAYHTHARERALKARGIKPRLARRANKHHPKLPPRMQRYNKLIARRRASVETTFATWKRRMGLHGIRYIGLAKASTQITLVAMAFNLRRWTALDPA